MSASIRAVAAFWNEDPDRFVFILEEFCLEMKSLGLAVPAIVDCRKGSRPPNFLLSDAKSSGLRGMKGVARGEVPFVKAVDAGSFTKDPAAAKRLFMLLADEESAESLFARVDDVLFICRAGSDSASVLYRLACASRASGGRVPRFHIMVAGVQKIEDAAAFFVGLRDELQKLAVGTAEFLFAGFCDLDFEKIEIARSARAYYRDLFRGDAFYGQLAHAARNLVSRIEPVETDLNVGDLFAALAERPSKG